MQRGLKPGLIPKRKIATWLVEGDASGTGDVEMGLVAHWDSCTFDESVNTFSTVEVSSGWWATGVIRLTCFSFALILCLVYVGRRLLWPDPSLLLARWIPRDRKSGSSKLWLSREATKSCFWIWACVANPKFQLTFHVKRLQEMMEQRSQIVECNLLHESSQYWLPLLEEELSLFPSRLIVTLGEPLLKAPLIDAKKTLVRRYWRYTPDWVRTKAVFSFVSQEENKLYRRLFTFPHQPSLRKRFYGATLQSYLGYMKAAMTQG